MSTMIRRSIHALKSVGWAAVPLFVMLGCTDDPADLTAPDQLTDEVPVVVDGDAADMLGGPGIAVYGVGNLSRPIPNPCPNPGYRDFDFWVGQWNVEQAVTGDPIGTSIISSELGGCVVMEDIIAVNGTHSRSLSAFDVDTDTWVQSFLIGNTTNIRLSGGLQGSDMVMTASQLAFNISNGTVGLRDHTVTWTPNPDGTVNQLVEVTFGGVPLPPGRLKYLPAPSLDRADPAFLPFCQAFVIPGFRQLDFWLGSWDVSSENGPQLGTSEVVTQLNDCLVVEDFVTPRGFRSRSYVFYDFVTATWHRTYVDEGGELVHLSGGLEGDPSNPRMVMTGTDVAPDGSEFMVRVTITPAVGDPLTPDLVRNLWEVSHDVGTTWQSALVLEYARR